MKVLINTSNLVVGGALQVATSLINEFASLISAVEFVVVCSQQIENQLEFESFPSNFIFYTLEMSPSRLKTRKKVISQLNTIETKENPDIVFSVFGPSYWTPRAKHLMGFALPMLVNPKSIFFKIIPFALKVKMLLLSNYQKSYFLKNANYYWCETEDVKLRMIKYLKINKNNINVVGNTHAKFYLENYDKSFHLPGKKTNEFRLITISANYPHKNLKIISEVSRELDKLKNHIVKFYVTLPQDEFDKLFGKTHSSNIINLGVVSPKDCPYIYEQCDALFLPTLLECFTASYPEAMVMKKPIITSDLSFARDLCEGSAIYFNPIDKLDIVNKISLLMNSSKIQSNLISSGLKRVSEFPSATKRAEKIFEILLRLKENTNFKYE